MFTKISTTENYRKEPTLFLNSIVNKGNYKGFTVKELKIYNKKEYSYYIHNYEGDIDQEVYKFRNIISKKEKLEEAESLVSGFKAFNKEQRIVFIKRLKINKSDLFFFNEKTQLLELK